MVPWLYMRDEMWNLIYKILDEYGEAGSLMGGDLLTAVDKKLEQWSSELNG